MIHSRTVGQAGCNLPPPSLYQSMTLIYYICFRSSFENKISFSLAQIIDRIPDSDPNAMRTRVVCQKALEDTETQQEYTTSTIYPPLYMSMGLMLTAIAYTYWSQILQLYDDLFWVLLVSFSCHLCSTLFAFCTVISCECCRFLQITAPLCCAAHCLCHLV